MPKSDLERMVGVLVFLIGVTLTSSVVETLNNNLSKFQQVNAQFNEDSRLDHFFGTLRQFNDNAPLKSSLRTELEDYFRFRWECNRNHAISTSEDRDLLEQLPDHVQAQIYSDFLFKDLVGVYQKSLFGFLRRQENRHFHAILKLKKDIIS